MHSSTHTSLPLSLMDLPSLGHYSMVTRPALAASTAEDRQLELDRCVQFAEFQIMRFPRASGILLHPISLPGPNGIGEIGSEAFRFADWLAEAGQKIWQVLPLSPTGCGDSPYQCFSAFAGNPLLSVWNISSNAAT
jgi:hypothetical protein